MTVTPGPTASVASTLRVLTPSLSPWDVINRRSVEEAEFLEDSEAASIAISAMIRGAMLFAQKRGIRPDEVQVDEVRLSKDGVFTCRFQDPYTQKV